MTSDNTQRFGVGVSQMLAAGRVMSVVIFSLLLLPVKGLAANYEIVVQEGAYQYNKDLPMTDNNNKYLAKVTIKKNGLVVVTDIRASTLPDAAFFYHSWHSEKKAKPPTDNDVEQIFKKLKNDRAALEAAWNDSNSFIANLIAFTQILEVLNAVPVIWSGKYEFVTGLHKGGKSVHGKPFAVRTIGGSTIAKAYDGRTASPKPELVGGFLATINENAAQGMRKVANGINIHDGRISKDYKDSEGCITIHPDHWNRFHNALPKPGDWTSSQHVGKLSVSRQ